MQKCILGWYSQLTDNNIIIFIPIQIWASKQRRILVVDIEEVSVDDTLDMVRFFVMVGSGIPRKFGADTHVVHLPHHDGIIVAQVAHMHPCGIRHTQEVGDIFDAQVRTEVSLEQIAITFDK